MDLKHSEQNLYFKWLLLPYILFIFRVCAQLLQKYNQFSFLPPFESWYSGALSYERLLIAQLIIIAVMTRTIFLFHKNKMAANYHKGLFLFVFACFYLGIMFFRLIMGLTIANHHYWFSARIPTFFHMVLAFFIFLVGHYHYTYGRKHSD